jgi:hypothetical protein
MTVKMKIKKPPKSSQTIPKLPKGTRESYRAKDMPQKETKRLKPRKLSRDEFDPRVTMFELQVRIYKAAQHKQSYNDFNVRVVPAQEDSMYDRPKAAGWGLTFEINGTEYHVHEDSVESTFEHVQEKLDEYEQECDEAQRKQDLKARALERARDLLTPEEIEVLNIR